jgi:DNA polymerase III subunit delta'
LQPYEGGWRIFIVIDADRLSTEAANALLKTLEEPPPRVLLVLTVAAEDRVIPTIRSRCQAVHLQRVPTPVLAAALVYRFALPVPDAEALAALAQGAPGAAISAAGDPDATEKLEDDLGRLRELLEADLPERLTMAGAFLEGPESGRSNAGDILARWELWWRDLLLVHQSCSTGLVYTTERENYQRIALGLEFGQVHRALKAVQQAREQLQQNALPRLVLDVLVLEFPPLIKL